PRRIEHLAQPLRLASLHQQQRNEIMYVVSVSVNKFLKHFTRQPRLKHFSLSKPQPRHHYLPLPSRSLNREGTEL
ncbi:hypothetical protein, partial [Caballeronia sp. GAFFF1]|uniref:hypothetical protein n=1 Tax=Caballeronia sp. GAFFF1 TaxID=2921779 RepID=UPI002027C059